MDQRDEPLICVVDDDASLRRSLRNLLLSMGFRVETFESGEAFLASAEPGRIGCLLLDVRMAGMSGIELLRHLAATGARVPVVMLTAHGDGATCRRSFEAGAMAFLEKPVRTEALLEAVRAALSRT
jgi:FixJ family two-component response regulator